MTDGWFQAQEACERCEKVSGHEKDCPRRYRDCWTFGIKKPGKDGGEDEKGGEK